MRRIACCLSLVLVLAGCSTFSAILEPPCLTTANPQNRPAPSGTALNLDQCWKKGDLIRYYTTSQGAHLVPYRLVMPLELAVPDKADPSKLVFTGEPFFTRSHIEDRWRFLALDDSDWNPKSDVHRDDIATGWPVGFVIDTRTSGKQKWRGEWLGPTCAACHTTQLEYQDGKTKKEWKVRVAGGPTMADVNLFLRDLTNSFRAVYEDGKKGGDRFKQYAEKFAKKIDSVESLTPFGNRETKVNLNESLLTVLGDIVAQWTAWHERNDPENLPGHARLDAFGVIYNEVLRMVGATPVLREQARSDAPTSYPFLWDTSHHDWTQWNGYAPDIPMGRNAGQALGVFAKYDPGYKGVWNWDDPSTIRIDNQRRIQALVDKLRAPRWPADIFGQIDGPKWNKGQGLFLNKCLPCHAEQGHGELLKKISVTMMRADEVGTDPGMVENANRRIAISQTTEIVRVNNLVGALGKEILATTRPLALASEAIPVFFQCYVLKPLSFFTIECKLEQPKLEAYKGRPLDGIWATAPFLHNGSVANLYQLLLPESERLTGFCVGSREFDPVRIGFETLVDPVKPDYAASRQECDRRGLSWLDTTLEGNSNTGHKYGVRLCNPGNSRCTTERHEEIMALVEYMKESPEIGMTELPEGLREFMKFTESLQTKDIRGR